MAESLSFINGSGEVMQPFRAAMPLFARGKPVSDAHSIGRAVLLSKAVGKIDGDPRFTKSLWVLDAIAVQSHRFITAARQADWAPP